MRMLHAPVEHTRATMNAYAKRVTTAMESEGKDAYVSVSAFISYYFVLATC